MSYFILRGVSGCDFIIFCDSLLAKRKAKDVCFEGKVVQ